MKNLTKKEIIELANRNAQVHHLSMTDKQVRMTHRVIKAMVEHLRASSNSSHGSQQRHDLTRIQYYLESVLMNDWSETSQSSRHKTK